MDVDLDLNGNATAIRLTDKPMRAVGNVQEIYPEKRDSVICPFPCFEVDVKFHGGLSGGPVMNHRDGAVCGVVCTGIDDGSEGPAGASFVSTIWPLLLAPVSAGRYPQLTHIERPLLIDLALNDAGLNLRGLEQLDLRWFPGREKLIRKYARKNSTLEERLRAAKNAGVGNRR